MRHNNLQSLAFMTSISAAILLAGCTADPLVPSKSEEYSREFVKNFGAFDRSHDWNHATHTTVNVTTSRPTDIKIYADVDGTRYTFGTYLQVNGRQTLDVDIPKGVTDLIVNANGRNFPVKPSGSVNIDNTARSRSARSMNYGEYPVTVNGVEQTITISPTDEADWRTYSDIDINGFESVMVEGELNINKPNVTLDFVFRSVGPIIIYPVYWNTIQDNKLGIAYKDDNGEMQHIELWGKYRSDTFDPENNILGITTYNYVEKYSFNDFKTNETIKNFLGDKWHEDLDPNEITPVEYLNLARQIIGENVKSVLTVNGGLCNGSPKGGEYANNWGDGGNFVEFEYITYDTPFDPDIKGVGTGDAVKSLDRVKGCKFSKGIKVDIPVGMRYGMYIERGDGTRLYSVADNNPDPLLQRDENGQPIKGPDGQTLTVEGKQAFHAATWIGPKFGWTWLGFEDWLTIEGSSISDMDLNDMVFLIDNPNHDDTPVEVEKPDDPEPEPQEWEWIIACEDLGTNDFDFNDVVFSVSGPVTEVATDTKTVKVTALAAGGTLPVYLYYGDTALSPDGQDESEFHSWFEGGHSSSSVINASGIRAKGKTATITVPGSFTMACCQTVTDGESGNMGGFKVMVKHNDGTTVIAATNPNIESEIGTAPQMICVPATWYWPKESVHIRNVYPDFVKWCQDGHNATHDWHKNRNDYGYWTK